MYYHLQEHIYITQFQNEVILLNTKKDKYTICFKELSVLLLALLEEHPDDLANKPSLVSQPFFQELMDAQVIEEKDTTYPFHIDRKLESDGVSNVDWSLPLENNAVSLNISVLRALITLLQVNFYIKVRGLHSMIQLIKKSRKAHINYIIPDEQVLKDLAHVVNKACLVYPVRTKCLEWAVTFVLLALKQKWKCNLEIGVQNYPFIAHAWVECNEKVVMDSEDLRLQLAIILNEPFKKLKT